MYTYVNSHKLQKNTKLKKQKLNRLMQSSNFTTDVLEIHVVTINNTTKFSLCELFMQNNLSNIFVLQRQQNQSADEDHANMFYN